jgi:hypothetical protein
MAMLNAPFAKAKVERAKVKIEIEDRPRAARMDEAIMPRTVFEPGEKAEVRVRWFHYKEQPSYSRAAYSIKLPEDLPDGDYTLTIGSSSTHARALQIEKPHWFRAESLPEILEAMNRVADLPDNRVYVRLSLPTGGLAVNRLEMPELPSFRREIMSASKRSAVREFTDAMFTHHETEFAVNGETSFKITVDRRAGQ